MDQFNQLINPQLCAKNEKNPSKRHGTLYMSLFPHGPILALCTPKGPMGEVRRGPKKVVVTFYSIRDKMRTLGFCSKQIRQKNIFGLYVAYRALRKPRTG